MFRMKKSKESKTVLKVLCLEDDFKDAELANEMLVDADYKVSMDIATGEKEYVDFLKGKSYDIILADNSLPSFDAVAALKVAITLKPEIPFICVSGTIGEENAVELLNKGASDYVIKGRMNRFAFAVHRALKGVKIEKERKQVEAELELENNALIKLNQFAIELSNLASGDNLESLIVKRVKEMTCAEVAIFSDYNYENRTTTTKHIEMESGLLEKVVNLLGKQIIDIHSVLSEEDYRLITAELVGVRKTLYEASFGAIPRSVGATIQALLKVDRIIGLAYVIEGKLYGTSLLLMGKGQPDPPKKILVNFIHLAALSVRRKKAEESKVISNLKYKELTESISDVFFALDKTLKYTYWNKASEALTGISAENAIGKSLKDIFPDNKSRKQVEDLCLKVIESEKPQYETITYPNNDNIIHEIGVYPNIEGVSVFIKDITERKKVEEGLMRKMAEITTLNKELEIFAHANKELEQFAFIASHNLQEPLRTISNFVQIMNEDYSEQLDNKAQQYLNVINDASHRMMIQLNSLLDFSRLGRNLKLTKVDCRHSIDNVIADLKSIIATSNASIEVGKMPVLNVYENEFNQLFQNFILNAIKFHRKDISPKILISSEKQNDLWKFSISDNGIGIEPENFDKMFVMFQRLHSDSEYQGSGIGLAFCNKIVQLHKGEIWVESTIGQGTTFNFTIPNLT
jgi:PAS domain S-box-containing protein